MLCVKSQGKVGASAATTLPNYGCTSHELASMSEYPPLLFHYCPSAAFLSILKSKKLWLSSTSNMSDYAEVHWARRLIDTEISRFAETRSVEASGLLLELNVNRKNWS